MANESRLALARCDGFVSITRSDLDAIAVAAALVGAASLGAISTIGPIDTQALSVSTVVMETKAISVARIRAWFQLARGSRIAIRANAVVDGNSSCVGGEFSMATAGAGFRRTVRTSVANIAKTGTLLANSIFPTIYGCGTISRDTHSC